jgi:chemotaxis response regulator CheB
MDNYLMIGKQGKLLVTKGAQENRSRPGIDPLFRSAAVAFGNRLTGIILTGYLDDGTRPDRHSTVRGDLHRTRPGSGAIPGYAQKCA